MQTWAARNGYGWKRTTQKMRVFRSVVIEPTQQKGTLPKHTHTQTQLEIPPIAFFRLQGLYISTRNSEGLNSYRMSMCSRLLHTQTDAQIHTFSIHLLSFAQAPGQNEQIRPAVILPLQHQQGKITNLSLYEQMETCTFTLPRAQTYTLTCNSLAQRTQK